MSDMQVDTKRTATEDLINTQKSPSLETHPFTFSERSSSSVDGAPLPKSVRQKFETAFQADFGEVRLHTDEVFSSGAAAYTQGSHIYFAPDCYEPHSLLGQQLLAHELTHIVQQQKFSPVDSKSLKHTSQRGDAAEQEADALAQQAVTGQLVHVSAAPTAAIQHGFWDWTKEASTDAVNWLDDTAADAVDWMGNTVSDVTNTSSNARNGIQGNLVQSPKIHSVGWRPEENLGPYAHLSIENGRRLSIGAGLLKHQWNSGSQVDAINGNIDAGVLGELGRNARYGMKGDVQLFNGRTDNHNVLGFDGGVCGANAEVSGGQDGATIGAGGYIVQGALRVGNLSAHEINDEQLRIGLGAGAGASGRLHYGDNDKDGHREYGWGADFGPLSFDLKTEDPLMTALKHPFLVGGLGGWITDKLTDDEDTNLTQSTLQNASKAWNWLADY